MPETRNAHQSDEEALSGGDYQVVQLTANFNRPPYTQPLHRNLRRQDDPNHPNEGSTILANQVWATYLAAPSIPG